MGILKPKKEKYSIRNNIRTLRFHKKEMTQEELANLVGVSRQTVNAIEKGKYSPTLELSFKIAQVFEVSLAEVFSYEKEN